MGIGLPGVLLFSNQYRSSSTIIVCHPLLGLRNNLLLYEEIPSLFSKSPQDLHPDLLHMDDTRQYPAKYIIFPSWFPGLGSSQLVQLQLGSFFRKSRFYPSIPSSRALRMHRRAYLGMQKRKNSDWSTE